MNGAARRPDDSRRTRLMKYLFDHLDELEAALDGKASSSAAGFRRHARAHRADAGRGGASRRDADASSSGSSESSACTVAIVSGRALERRPGQGRDRRHHLCRQPRTRDGPAERRAASSSHCRSSEAVLRADEGGAGRDARPRSRGSSSRTRGIRSPFTTAWSERRTGRASRRRFMRRWRHSGASGRSSWARARWCSSSGRRSAATRERSCRRSSNRRRSGAARRSTFAIYLGDDATDEDAFKAIRGRGWAVLVGAPRISYAEYYLNDPRRGADAAADASLGRCAEAT